MNAAPQENKESPKTKVIYTPFGYGEIEDLLKIQKSTNNSQEEIKEKIEDPKSLNIIPENIEIKSNNADKTHVKVKLKDGGYAYIDRDLIFDTITLFIKTFFGPRKNIEIQVDIKDTILILKEKLLKLDEGNEMINYHQIRLIYPMGKLRELPSSARIQDLRLPTKCQLVLVGQKSFYFDNSYKGNDIVLSNNMLTANKRQLADYETVLGSLGFSSGRHYWEITLDSFVDLEDIFIGVSTKDINLYQRPTEGLPFWGYIPASKKKFGIVAGTGNTYGDYGEMCKAGETIGVLLSFDNEEATLSFYLNKKSLGVAFTNLVTMKYYPAVCLYYSSVQVTLNTQAIIPKY